MPASTVASIRPKALSNIATVVDDKPVDEPPNACVLHSWHMSVSLFTMWLFIGCFCCLLDNQDGVSDGIDTCSCTGNPLAKKMHLAIRSKRQASRNQKQYQDKIAIDLTICEELDFLIVVPVHGG